MLGDIRTNIRISWQAIQKITKEKNMEIIKGIIGWVKANKKKTVIGLVVILIVLNMLGVIGGGDGEVVACLGCNSICK